MTTPNYVPPTVPSPKHPAANKQSNSNLAMVSMILGIVSIVTFMGLLLGIPAIVLGIMALRRNTSDKGMSIAGIITGAISTLISIVVLGFIIMIAIFAAADYEQDRMYQEEQQSEYYNESAPSSSEL